MENQSDKAITIIIPAYNEATGIENVLNRLKSTLSEAPFKWELLVVDDGSSDGTSEIVQKSGIRTIRHSENRGYGAALKTGIRSSNTPWFAIIDADGTYPEDELIHLSEFMDESDMIIGARTGASVHIPLIRRPAKAFITWLAGYVSSRKIPDLNSGLRIMRKEAVLKYIHLLPDGFSFTSTISIAMLVDGYRVKYVPINYHHRKGKSKIRPVYDTLNFMSLIVRTIMYFRPLRVFFPFSIFLFLLGILVLPVSFYATGRIMDSSSTILLMSSVQVLALGLLAEVVVRRTSS
ncbi:glycosyltransferase family 2 protein [Myxococcota bacterium]|nr:glycosyltransferase family 2 protein [Myxococcota bacterium]MBU1381067.1 glycosyltransferase family 2 protein [Myxococcota bacterium]MBU1499122.1 glycosyltransferase family 2 protein [Myxococcota bacterium]